MEEFKNLKRVALNEARKLDAAYANKDEFATEDAEQYECIMHGLKCQLTAEAMLNAGHYEEDPMQERGRSYDGRRMSYDRHPAYSGHYPPQEYPRYW